ncbi:hypothetical protein DFS34DRAFT_618859 [Phlyctochytrium arcticum]|nr:hypothetical protein DFS34DRAFT_618859 [Phlyctochytrium arcticum]
MTGGDAFKNTELANNASVLSEVFASLAESGEHTIKLTLEIHYALDKTAPAQTFTRVPGKDKGDGQPRRRKNAMDDYAKFYVTYSIAGRFEGKTDILSLEGSPWTWSCDVEVNSAFLADILDKSIDICLYEATKLEVPATGQRASVIRKLGGSTMMGSRTRLNSTMDPKARRSSMEALAKRQLFLANKQLPIKERYSVVKKASAGGSPGGLENTVEGTDEEVDDERTQEKIKGRRANSKKGLEAPPVELEDEGVAKGKTPPRPLTGSPKRRSPEHSRLREESVGPQPHHYDKPERHLSARGRSARMRQARGASDIDDFDLRQQPLTSPSDRKRSPERTQSPERNQQPQRDYSPDGKNNPKHSKSRSNSPDKLNEKRNSSPEPPGQPLMQRRGTIHLSDLNLAAAQKNGQIPKLPNKREARSAKTRSEMGKIRKPDDNDKAGIERSLQALGLKNKGMPTTFVEKKKTGDLRHDMRCYLELDAAELFWGETTISSEHSERNVEGLSFCRASIVLSSPLLSKEQEASLNPLRITLLEADGMPDKPISYEDLKRRCLPVTARFRFFNDLHINQAIASTFHSRTINFNTRHLVLTGLLDEDTLRDELLNKKFEVEIHDRDFEQESMNDAKRSSPFGVGSYSLADLALGEKHLELITPILPSRYSEATGRSTVPAGLWLESAATLSIRVEIKAPILANAKAGSLSEGLYGRIVISTSADDDITPEIIHTIMMEQNVAALTIQGDSQMDQWENLKSYEFTDEDRDKIELDVLTGYHFSDVSVRIFLIEGLLGSGVNKLISTLQSHSNSSVKVMFNPDVTFTARIWMNKPYLVNVWLEPSLKTIMGQTSTYLRKNTSLECFECADRLNQMVSLAKPSTVGSFPLANMIDALVSMFGRVVSFEEAAPIAARRIRHALGGAQSVQLANLQHNVQDFITLAPPYRGPTVLRPRSQGVESKNIDFEQWLRYRRNCQPNFITINYKKQAGRQALPRLRDYQDDPVHNYSIQTNSSVAKEMAALRRTMDRDLTRIYSYGGKFLSQYVTVADYDEAVRKNDKLARSRWMTKSGFRVPNLNHIPAVSSSILERRMA